MFDKFRQFFHFLAIILAVFSAEILTKPAYGVIPSNDRFIISVGSKTLEFPYVSNYSIETPNDQITNILIFNHGVTSNADWYFNEIITASTLAPGVDNKTLIVVPQFLEDDSITNLASIDANLLYWDVYPFWGSYRALRGSSRENLRISAYEVLDIILNHLVYSNQFQNLKKITIAGHSAGGQLVQRYAASNRFHTSNEIIDKIEISYIVMAPASYVYMSSERYMEGSNYIFSQPTNQQVSNCPNYNDYGYGLENLYDYLNITGKESIVNQYKNRSIYYFVGSEDNDPNGLYLNTSCAANLQGSDRVDRMEKYNEYLKYFYGADINYKHKFFVIDGVNHNGVGVNGLIGSDKGLCYVFDYVIDNSQAATTLITHYYFSILRREPDSSGLAHWQNLIADRQSKCIDAKPVFRDMANFFFNSPEYIGRNTADHEFIANLYLTFFQREPDQGGYAFWLEQLANGMTRNEAMTGFLYSPEFTRFMESLGF